MEKSNIKLDARGNLNISKSKNTYIESFISSSLLPALTDLIRMNQDQEKWVLKARVFDHLLAGYLNEGSPELIPYSDKMLIVNMFKDNLTSKAYELLFEAGDLIVARRKFSSNYNLDDIVREARRKTYNEIEKVIIESIEPVVKQYIDLEGEDFSAVSMHCIELIGRQHVNDTEGGFDSYSKKLIFTEIWEQRNPNFTCEIRRFQFRITKRKVVKRRLDKIFENDK